MARSLSDLSANELRERLAKVQGEKDDLNKKLQKNAEEHEAMLRIADMAIVESSDDFRIINSSGAIEYIFKDVIKKFERGENLIIFVKKITKTSRCIEGKDPENTKKVDLDPLLTKFIDGHKDDIDIRMLGERDDGELFLLEWTLKKQGNRIKSYFKFVPSNKVIKEAQEHLDQKLQKNEEFLYEVFEMLTDGVIIMDIQSRIKFISNKARDLFIPKDNKVLRSVQFEGRMLSEIMLGVESDEAKEIQDNAKRVLITKDPLLLKKSINKKMIEFHVSPMFDENKKINGIFILSRSPEDGSASVESQKLMQALKNMSEDNRVMAERIKELEYNHKWFMKNNKEYQQTIKQLYSFLENTPLPLSIIELPKGVYGFVNKQFEKKFEKPRSDVLGQKEDEILSEEDNRIIRENLEQTIVSHDVVHLETDNISLRQVCIYNSSKDATHLIRMYYDKMEEGNG